MPPSSDPSSELVIVGGGVAGLALAARLEQESVEYQLLEARSRLGGRVLSEVLDGGAFDLGPAWFWPEQPRMRALTTRLGLEVFEQYFEGDIMSEDQNGNVRRGSGVASMQGSLRIAGGLGCLIEGLASQLPETRLRRRARVSSIEQQDEGLRLSVVSDRGSEVLHPLRVVLALPPRVAEATIEFAPALPPQVTDAMAAIPTWMAGHAKIVAVYDRPYWRESGLSGDAVSGCGPMVEIHDASPKAGGPYALFGFVGFPPKVRDEHHDEMMAMAREQLVRLFGPAMSSPQCLRLQDWAMDPLTATPADHQPLRHHPDYGMPQALTRLWDDRLLFSSTEVATEFGGYLEGALQAAENAAEEILQRARLGA